MRRYRADRALAAVTAALALSLSAVAFAQPSGSWERISLPEGTVLRAQLNDSLSSTSSRPGDRFTGTIAADPSGLPSGTQVVGQVVEVQRANDRHPGIVDVDFRSLRLRDGRTFPVEGRLTSLDSGSVQQTASGRLVARGRGSKNNARFIGYGAGAGAVISALTGGSALKGALLGAVGGYLYQQSNKNKASNRRYAEVQLKPGTEFGVLLDRTTVVNLAQHPYLRSSPYSPAPRSRWNTPLDAKAASSGGPYPSSANARTAGSFQQYAGGEVRVLVDGSDVRFPQDRPFVVRGHVMLPLDPVLAALDCAYSYDPRAREVTIRQNQRETRFTIGENFATVDGESVRLDEPVQRIDGTLYVPSRLLEEATGARADWDANTRVLRLR